MPSGSAPLPSPAAFAPVELLTAAHDRTDVDCGSEAQTTWLRNHALQAHESGTSRVFVVTRAGSPQVLGYFALAAGSVEQEAAPPRIRKGTGRYAIPVAILTRLGVDRSVQGYGLGAALVRDALLRVEQAADTIGVRALLIHCESADARAFYEHLAEFEQSPTDPLHLVLLMKDQRAALRG